MIETARCLLHDLRLSDVKHIIALETNHDVRRFLGGPKDEQAVRLDFYRYSKPSRCSQRWVIRHKGDGAFIGMVTVDMHHNGVDRELSYQILPAWWGQGYATETLRAVIGYSFKEMALSRLVAETQVANLQSCRLLERLGFHIESQVERFGATQAIYVMNNMMKVKKNVYDGSKLN